MKLLSIVLSFEPVQYFSIMRLIEPIFAVFSLNKLIEVKYEFDIHVLNEALSTCN